MNHKIVRRIGEIAESKQVTLNVIGKIKIGERVATQSGKERPTAIDYFRPHTSEQYAELFRQAYGDRPKRLTITFISDNLAESCFNFYEMRDGAGKVIAYGDGINFKVSTMQADRVQYVDTTPTDSDAWMKEMESKSGKEWKEVLVLRFMLPEIPVLGYWEFRTQATGSTIPNIMGAVETMLKFAGRIALIPFDLSVKIVTSDKSGSKSKYPVVELVANISQQSAERLQRLPDGINVLLNEKRIAQLTNGEPDAEFAESFVIESTVKPITMTFADIEREFNNLTTAEDFNNARKKIIEIAKTDKATAGTLAAKLGDKAQQRALFHNKQTGNYE